MANVTVRTTANIEAGNRVSVRNSNDKVYSLSTDGTNLVMSRGNISGEPVSFVDQTISGITGLIDEGASCAIDSNDIIHCIFDVIDTGHGGLLAIRYVTYDTSTDTFGTPETIATLDNDATFIQTLGMTIDAGDKPHAFWRDSLTDMGTTTYFNYYSNKTSGSWRSKVTVSSATTDTVLANDIMIADPLSSVNADRPIIVVLDISSNRQLNAYYGDALDATSFTEELDITGSISLRVIDGRVSMAIDSNEKIVIAFVEFTSLDLMIVEHLNASAWTSWETPVDVDTSVNHQSPSIIIKGTDMYIYAVDDGNDDVRLFKDEGSGWSQETGDTDLPNAGTFNDVKARWANYANNLTPYDFDGNIVIEDPDFAWGNESNAADGDIDTDATSTDTTPGSKNVRELRVSGTTAPASGGTIKNVYFKIYGTGGGEAASNVETKIDTESQGQELGTLTFGGTSEGFKPAILLTVPSGGWTWAKIQKLEASMYRTGTLSGTARVARLVILVDVEDDDLDYVFEDSSGNVLYNTFSASGITEVDETHTTDILVQVVDNDEVHTTDLLVQVVDNDEVHSTDVLIVQQINISHSTDISVKELNVDVTHNTDVLVKVQDNDNTHSTDILVVDTKTITHSTDIYVVGTDVLHSTDVLVKVSVDKTHSTDVLVQQTVDLVHSTDVLVKDTDVDIVHNTDILVQVPDNEKSHSTDVLVIVATTVDHSTDILIKEKDIDITHSTDTLVKDTDVDLTTTTDILIQDSDIDVSHTTDILVVVANDIIHSTDILVLEQVDKSHSTDIFVSVVSGVTKTHTTDTLVKVIDSDVSHGTDVFVASPIVEEIGGGGGGSKVQRSRIVEETVIVRVNVDKITIQPVKIDIHIKKVRRPENFVDVNVNRISEIIIPVSNKTIKVGVSISFNSVNTTIKSVGITTRKEMK